MRLRGNLSGKRLRGQGTAAASLTPVDVVIFFGSSQGVGARDELSELPAGYYTTDNSAFIWDAAGNLDSGSAIRVLKAPSFSTATITIASPGVVTWTSHGLTDGDPVAFKTTGALPTGLATATKYYVVNAATNTFQVSATRGGSAINTSGTQSGTHTALANGGHEQQPNPAYVDTAYVSTIGPAGEFIKHYRADNPSSPLYFFNYVVGGGRFTDAGGLGRTANFDTALSDGAYAGLRNSWASFVAALQADGKTPNIILAWTEMGGGSASDATESSNYQTNMTALIAAVRSTVIGSARFLIHRMSDQLTGLNSTNRATIRAAQLAIATADSTVELMNTDGCGTGSDNIHFTAASHVAQGEMLYYHAANLWYPQKEWSYNGGTPVANEWRPGDLRNTPGNTAFTTTGGNVQTAKNLTGGVIAPTQATDSARPVISTTTLSNGYVARYATGDNVNDILTYVGAAPLGDGSYGLFSALSSAADTDGSAYAEGGAGTNPFLEPLKSDASGNLIFFHRNDAGTVTGKTIIANSAFNGTMNFVAVTDDQSTITGQVNGTSGTPLSYVGGTRGTTSLNRTSLFGINYNGGAGVTNFIPAKIGIVWTTETVPDAAYKSRARAYCQRRWGTA